MHAERDSFHIINLGQYKEFDMIDFDKEQSSLPAVRIAVFGVGGAGCNTVNALLGAWYEQVACVAVNTDVKALETSKAPYKVQIGVKSTKGLGSGANPELGRRAAEEDLPEILDLAKNSDIVFLIGGLGGGTGSGALPVIARALRERDVLSIAVVTKPFSFEGKRRMAVADEAESALRKEVDTLITIPNEKLLHGADKSLSLMSAFEQINLVISQFVKSIADIITKPGYINVDFADLKAIMKGRGLAVMGTGRASGENRSLVAAQQAIASPLLENVSIQGAKSVLLNVTGSSNLGLLEVSEAASLIMKEVHENAHIIIGSVIDDVMEDEVSVTVIATGFMECDAKRVSEIVSEKSDEVVICAEKVDEKTEIPVFSMKHPLKDLLMHEQATRNEQVQQENTQQLVSQQEIQQKELEIPTLLRKMVQEKRLQQKN